LERQEVVEQLDDLIADRETFITGDDLDETYIKDKQALQEAIKLIEGEDNYE